MLSLRNASHHPHFLEFSRGKRVRTARCVDLFRRVAVTPGRGCGSSGAVVSSRMGESNDSTVAVLRAVFRKASRCWDTREHETSLTGLIQRVSNGKVVGEHARRAIRRALGEANIWAWESHRYRTRAEVLSALGTAIGLLGVPKPPPSRGGRHVSSGPWKSEARS